jgi:DNA-binding transcriptional LysR family regulator
VGNAWDLNEMMVFAKVVQTGSFTRAAASLRMPKSTVSRKITELEGRLGARLLQRSTRTLSLTDEGRTYYGYCARIAGEVDEAERAVGRLREVPRGRLRVTLPLNFDFMAKIAIDFAKKYPEVELEMVETDRVIGLVEEGFDLAIRAGALADSTLIARPLASIRRVVAASPKYLDKRGRPRTPAALEKHDAIVFGAGASPSVWRLISGESTIDVAVKGRLVTNDFDVLVEAAIGGLGIAMMPIYRGLPAIREGKLERVLDAWCSPIVALHVVYSSTRHLSPKVKAFVEHLQNGFTPPPWEVGPPP